MYRTYVKTGNFAKNRHPREACPRNSQSGSGGPLNAMKNMDSRLRGNEPMLRRNCELCPNKNPPCEEFFKSNFFALQNNRNNVGLKRLGMFKKDLRDDARNPFVEALEYSIAVTEESQRIEDIAVCIDLSSKGIGILTNHPLRAGHIVDFKNSEKTDALSAKRAEVKWTEKIDNSIYRAGLKFT